MSIKSNYKNNVDKKYYILDTSFKITPVESYVFDKKDAYLETLVGSECFLKSPKYKNKQAELDKMINEIGFEWDPLSESGHMRQKPNAVTILEAIEKYIWLIASEFCYKNDISLHRISGGELFDSNGPQISRQISVVSKNLIYGTNQYNVTANKKKQILRYSACTQKLSVAKEANLHNKDLPVGIFEVSKSYRFEKEKELQLCKKVRSFRLPELHIINENLTISLKRALLVHQEILSQIQKFDQGCELFCSVTFDFFNKNFDFLKAVVKTIGKPFLLAVYNEGVNCGNGIKIDAEYKVFDTLMSPVEIATFQIDDGTSDFSFDVKCESAGGAKKPVSTIHTVFFSSLERAAYFFIDRAIKKEMQKGFRSLPFWLTPVQARIIPCSGKCMESAKRLAKDLNLSGFRVDIDDRKINHINKIKAEDLKWVPYVIYIEKNDEGNHGLTMENRIRGIVKKEINITNLVKDMRMEISENVVVPLYAPIFLSKRVIFS